MPDPFLVMTVAEDAGLRSVLRTSLSGMEGLARLEAPSGLEALRKAVERDVHLVLLEVEMAGMDGYETATHLRMVARTPELPIVFLTAAFDPEAFLQRGFDPGAVEHLALPIDPDQVQARVRFHQHPHPADAPPLPGIDWEAGLACFMGKRDLYEKMLRRFRDLNVDSGTSLREAWARGDRELAGRLAHSMASAAATIGARELAAEAAGLDRLLRDGGTPEAVQEAVSRYEAECADLIETLSDHCK